MVAPTLDSLPLEILYRIQDYLDGDRSSISRWSRASRVFHRLLLPSLLKTVAFDQSDASAESVRMSLASHPGLTTAIEFLDAHHAEDGCLALEAPIQDHHHDRSLKKIDGLQLSASAQEILSGEITGEVSSAVIEFKYERFGAWDWPSWCDLLNFYADQETQQSVLNIETISQCRRRQAAVWKALSANSHLKRLHIIGLTPYKISTFWSPRWKDFIGTLRELILDLQQPEDANIIYYGFHRFISDLPQVFFDHMPHLESLGLRMDRKISTSIDFNCYFPLTPDSLPNLKKLELRHIVLYTTLFDFLVQHVRTLEILNLNSCSSFSYGIYPDGGKVRNWQRLFEDLLRPDCALCQLEITPDMMAWPRATSRSLAATDPSNRANITYRQKFDEAFEGHRQKDQRTVFWYSRGPCADDLDWKTTWNQYELGEDAVAFKQLTELIQKKDGTAG